MKRNRVSRRYSLLLMALATAPLPANAQQTSSAIVAQAVPLSENVEPFILCRLLDAETGAPVAGAQVFLADTEVGGASDIDGFVVLPVPTAGTWTVVTRIIGYHEARIDLEVEHGTATQVLAALQSYPIPHDSIGLAPPLPVRPVVPDTTAVRR